MFRLFLGSSLCFFLVCLILQDFLDGLLLGRLLAFLCAGCGFPYPVADVPQLLQILLYLGQRYFQFCDFAEKRFLLLLQLLLGTVLIVRVLGKVGGGFLIPGNLRDIYCPITYTSDEDNWLQDIEYYSGEPFRADFISMH